MLQENSAEISDLIIEKLLMGIKVSKFALSEGRNLLSTLWRLLPGHIVFCPYSIESSYHILLLLLLLLLLLFAR